MDSQSEFKFGRRVFWFGLAVVTVLVVITVVKVDALWASAKDSRSVEHSVQIDQSNPNVSQISNEDVGNSLVENEEISKDLEGPKLLDDQFAIKRILEFDEPFVHGFWIWDDEGVPDGEIIITVDLKAESMSVFRDGHEIGAAVISFGDALKPTPTGVFPITQKSKDHVSNIYGTPMPYMLRMTNDGISIHGANVRWGWGTRGCIGVPTEFAAKLFEQVKLGDRVIVTDGKMLQVG